MTSKKHQQAAKKAVRATKGKAATYPAALRTAADADGLAVKPGKEPTKPKLKSKPRTKGEGRKAPASKKGRESYSPLDLASLAATIYNSMPRLVTAPINKHQHDGEYRDALDRAQWLLKEAASREASPVHAYQLFAAGSGVTKADDVCARFKEAGWTGMTSRSSLDPFVQEILEVARSDIQALEDGSELLGTVKRTGHLNKAFFTASSRGLIETLRDRLGLRRVLRDVDELTDRLVDVIIEEAGKQLPEILLDPEAEAELASAIHFVRHVAPGADDRDRSIRPHELLLYAAQKGLWPRKLVKPRDMLTDHLQLEPLRNDPYPILKSYAAMVTLPGPSTGNGETPDQQSE